MSDNNIISINKEISNLLQNKTQDSKPANSSSPKQNDSSSNLQLFKNTEINQRNFPSKANYFGQNNSRSNNSNGRNMSPGNQSPLFNYYTSLSPKFSKMGQFYSPENNFGGENTKHSPYVGGNIQSEQTFNFSPSIIFNNMNQINNTNNFNVFNNNFNNNQSGEVLNINNNTSNDKSLAEKMEHLVGKNNDNNTMNKNQNNNEQKSDDEEDNENDEMYLLALNISDDKENEEETNNYPHHINDNNNLNKNNINPQLNTNPQINNNNNNTLIQNPIENNINNNNINRMNNNINEIIRNNNMINQKINNINNTDNDVLKNNIPNLPNNTFENNKKVGITEKIINNGELPKPYIPNKYRNNNMEVNQINNVYDDSMLPSYGGTQNNNNQSNGNNNLVNNFTINNNINNSFNINNSIINNNLIGNPNFNMGYNNINNNPNNQNLNNPNFMMMNKNNSFQMNKEKEVFPYPTKIGEFLYQNRQANPQSFNHINENKFEIKNNMNNIFQMPQGNYFNNANVMNNNMSGNNFNINNNNNYINNFYYKGDNYQISQFKQYKKQDNSKNGQIRSICADDFVTTITSNKKKIKRIDPNTYLNESLEYLSYNILPLAKDQAGCRFLQEKLDKEPQATNLFFNAILPHIIVLVKDPFGNYLIQKICNNLNSDQIIKVLEKLSPTILDIGSNNHGTRVIQHLIDFLNNKKLIDYFLKSLEPYVIPLLKELNGTHIIQQFLMKHPDYAYIINKIIVENCASLASHSHGCCVLQKFLNGKDEVLKENLINNLINNCLVLIIDQYGNYVIQSILLLNENKSSSAIAMKIYDNVAYYSKHRYSSNVVEKCFDFCGKFERKKLAEKLSPPDILADLIMDEHGNYVIQKALACSETNEQEIILNNIIPLIPKIKNVSFGEKLLSRLMNTYPHFKNKVQMLEGNNSYRNIGNINNNSNVNFQNMNNSNNNNSGYNNFKKGNKKKKNKNNNNYFDNNNNNMGFNNNFFNNNNIMNNNMYFNKNDNIDDDRNNNYGKNRGNKKNKNKNFKNDKKRKNNFNNNDKNDNNQ